MFIVVADRSDAAMRTAAFEPVRRQGQVIFAHGIS